MDSPLVIKIKYGETLRCFSASVDANGLLELDMARLTYQIRVLFNFPPEADLTLTYIDEDNDEVTLVDDSDLYDATRQKLNPLRIQVIKNMVRPARFESTCSSARVRPHKQPPTEVCSDSESSNDPLKEVDDTKTVATRIRIMEAMSKMGETSHKVNFKSKLTANEKSKPTNGLSDHFSGCPVHDLATTPAQAVEGPTNEILPTESINNNTLSEVEAKVTSKAGKLNSYIDKGKSKMDHLDDFTDLESPFVLYKPSDACFVGVDVDYEKMLLDTLEQMGFKQADLNEEVLRKNLFDLGQTITDLCDMGESLNELTEGIL